MKSPVLTIDFFHDAVCGWCFVMSPKLRKLAAEFPIRVRHRTFVLQDSPAKLAAAFGSAEKAKSAILGHWERCAEHDEGGRINVEGMRRQRSPYPTGVRRQRFWAIWLPERREGLAHLVGLIMRRIFGEASAGFR
ncbi:DsbA family oxidoreductase [Leisingera sp. ANG1]|uniref:DsbA family oxidoreductase n=2 Tax=Leisingera TaxID=191028 RepID=UPI000691C4F7|nr:DsbA family protein [Leisingera sp. ANG1]